MTLGTFFYGSLDVVSAGLLARAHCPACVLLLLDVALNVIFYNPLDLHETVCKVP